MTDAWQTFFAAQIGAAAALLGLIFVGVSLNLTQILSQPPLPSRALLALLLLLAVVSVGSLALIPDQPGLLLGVEILLVGAFMTWAGISVSLRSWRLAPTGPAIGVMNSLLTALSVLPYLAGALLLMAGAGGALHWIAAAMIVSVIKAVTDAWVLLVEINR